MGNIGVILNSLVATFKKVKRVSLIILNNIFYLIQHVQNFNTLVCHQYKINVFHFFCTKFLKSSVHLHSEHISIWISHILSAQSLVATTLDSLALDIGFY